MSMSLGRFTVTLAVILAVGVWVPSSNAQNRGIQILSPESSSGAFLGIRMKDVTEDNMSEYKLDAVQGVIVESVVEGSPAETAELQEKDVILEYDGLKVRSTFQFSRLVRETPAGRGVGLVISRSGKRKNVTVRLQDRGGRRMESGTLTLPEPFYSPGDRYFNYRIPDLPEWNPDMIGRAPHRLGITIQALTDQMAGYLGVPGKNGVLVTSVMESSPSQGKLQAGDVIVRADGNAVGDPAALTRVLQRTSEDTISLDVIRDKKEINVVVNLADADGKPGEDGEEYKL